MKKIISVILVVITLFSLTACGKQPDPTVIPEGNVPVSVLYDYVLKAETLTEMDIAYAEEFAINSSDGWGGRCSAVAKVLQNGDMVVGRNMDYFISNYPAIIVHTKDPKFHETYGISYNNSSGPLYEEAKKNGLTSDYAKLLPFIVDDAMNDKGLYVEMNMRSNEHFDDPADDYGCSGTNPQATERVCEMLLPQLIALNCANIEEMLNYLNTINIFTMSKGSAPFNLAFLVAEASGRYGVLEIARNEISWLESQPIQTNYYITPSFLANETKKMGVGRYVVLEKGLPDVKTEADMQELIDKVAYFQMYKPLECIFDPRSELVDDFPEWNYDFVTDEANWGFMMSYMQEFSSIVLSATRQQLQDANVAWETIYSSVVNCSAKTMQLRFFENASKVVTLSFNEE